MHRRRFLHVGAGATAAAALGVGVYSWRLEPRWTRVIDHDLPVTGLPAALDGRRLVQISDIHVGPRVDEGYIAHVFEIVDALEADIVVMTGDYVTWNGGQPLDQLRRVLTRLPRARLGVVGILGNHDYGRGWREGHVASSVAAELDRAGVVVLRNERVTLGGLTIAGFDDLWSGQFNPRPLMEDATLPDASVVLCHNPDSVDEPGWGSYRGWVLSGHTHGGQVQPPFLPPLIIPVKNKRYTRGEIALSNGRQLYINAGIGHLMRVRFNVRPEITVHTLRIAARRA